jgi:hypothetical protein
LLSGGSLEIKVANVENDECLKGYFKALIEAENEGYEVVKKHRYTQRDLPGWSPRAYDLVLVMR